MEVDLLSRRNSWECSVLFHSATDSDIMPLDKTESQPEDKEVLVGSDGDCADCCLCGDYCCEGLLSTSNAIRECFSAIGSYFQSCFGCLKDCMDICDCSDCSDCLGFLECCWPTNPFIQLIYQIIIYSYRVSLKIKLIRSDFSLNTSLLMTVSSLSECGGPVVLPSNWKSEQKEERRGLENVR